MSDRLKKILIELETFSEKSKSSQRKTMREIERIANLDRQVFENTISNIKPSTDSVLFEVYEALSINPSEWFNFILLEFRRIKEIAETSHEEMQESIVSPLLAISFFARKEFNGLNKLIHEFSLSVKSSSVPVVKISMDLLMDSFFIDSNKYSRCKSIVVKLTNSPVIEIKEFAKGLLKDKAVNPVLHKLKTIVLDNSWIIWSLALLLLISFKSGVKTGFLVIGLFTAGNLLGYLIPMIINILKKRSKAISIWKEVIAFIGIIIILYLSLENKRTLVLVVPFSIPILIGGLLALKE